MYEFPQQMKITTGNGLQLATERPKEKLVQMFDELQKELNEKFKEMHDKIAQFMKMYEAEKHKANQLQKNIISENDDARDNILFPPERSHNLDRSFRNIYIVPSFPTREQHTHSVQNARSRFNKLNQSYSC